MINGYMGTENKINILKNLCYTELVYGRINKKLKIDLPNEDIEALMIKVIDSCDSIEKLGKNYYISNFEYKIRVTVNSYTFRIITVDKMADKTKLTSLRNIGKEIETKLVSVGINSAEELIAIGSKNAFLRLRTAYSNVCLVHLYTLQGAIDDIDYNKLSEEVKLELKDYNDYLSV